jgi:tetratricopeptide (TPR) repeat protein
MLPQFTLSSRSAEEEAARDNFEEAYRLLRRTLEQRRDSHPSMYLRAARAARRAEQLLEADRLLEEAARRGADPGEVVFEGLLLQAQAGYALETHPALANRLAVGIEVELCLEALGRGYLHAYRLPEARECFDALLRLRPRSLPGLLALAELRRQSPYLPWGFNPETWGIPELRQAVSIAPRHFGARLRLAKALAASRLETDGWEVESHLRAALRIRPGDLDARALLGAVLIDQAPSHLDELPATEAEGRLLLEGVIAEQPDHVQALRSLARLYQRWDDPVTALRLYRRALNVAPQDREALSGAWQILTFDETLNQPRKTEGSAAALQARLDDVSSAENELNEMKGRMTGNFLSDDPNDPEWRYRAGLAALRLGRRQEARLWFERALIENATYRPARRALQKHFGDR